MGVGESKVWPTAIKLSIPCTCGVNIVCFQKRYDIYSFEVKRKRFKTDILSFEFSSHPKHIITQWCTIDGKEMQHSRRQLAKLDLIVVSILKINYAILIMIEGYLQKTLNYRTPQIHHPSRKVDSLSPFIDYEIQIFCAKC